MLLELVLLILLGIVFIAVGLMIWKKRKLSLINSGSKTVPEIDVPAYTTLVGKGVVLLGIGMPITGFIDYFTSTFWGWAAFALCFIAGIAIVIAAERRYRR